METLPSYQQAVAYYLRDDVSTFMWRLSQTRPLKFFHHCGHDLRTQRGQPKSIAIHCIESAEELRERIREATSDVPAYPYPFFPFWGMQSTEVNTYGVAGKTIGWDMRFEFDLELQESFAIVLPVAAVLRHLGISHLLKYSGQRSLHFIVPAEAFPAAMKGNADHKHWMSVLDLIGDFFCRISPYLNPTNIGLSKGMILTAPYSFHRYNGLLSIPLTVDEALHFEPASARLERFSGVVWPFPDSECQGKEMAGLIRLATEAEERPKAIVEVARKAFAGSEWEDFFGRMVPRDVEQDSMLGLLTMGVGGLGRPAPTSMDRHPVHNRLERAVVAMDNPQNKAFKELRLIGEVGFNVPLETLAGQRRLHAEVLNEWIHGGCDLAVERILAIVDDSRYNFSFLLGLRLVPILPEDNDVLLDWLMRKLPEQHEPATLRRLFFILAIAQLPGGALHLWPKADRDPGQEELLDLLSTPEVWHVDADPQRAVVALCLELGTETIRRWLATPDAADAKPIIENVFEGNVRKFQHAARRLALADV